MMTPIDSSMFTHIGWEDDTLYLRMKPTKKQEIGDLWRYPNYVHGLPETPKEGWGKWWHANIKGKYEGEKVVEVLTMDNGSEIHFDATITPAEPGEEF